MELQKLFEWIVIGVISFGAGAFIGVFSYREMQREALWEDWEEGDEEDDFDDIIY